MSVLIKKLGNGIKNVIINDPDCLKKFKKLNYNKNIKIFSDFNSFKKIFKKKIDYAMISITGINGLDPTLKIIKFILILYQFKIKKLFFKNSNQNI